MMDKNEGIGGITQQTAPETAIAPLDPFEGEYMKPVAACGPCDPEGVGWRGLETALNLRRYATVFVNLTRTAGGNLLVAGTGATPLQAFGAGYKENGANTGLLPTTLNLTRAETDGYTEGALGPNKDWNYRIVGVGVLVGVPFRAATLGTDAGGRICDPFWVAGDYPEQVARLLLDTSHFTFKHGKADSGFEMGRLSFYPSMSSILGRQGVSVGNPLASAFIPLRFPDFAGGPDDDDAVTVEISIDRSFQVNADPLVPVPVLGAGEAYLLPVTVELYGHTIRVARGITKHDVQGAVMEQLALLTEGLDPTNPTDLAVFQRIMKAMRKK